MCGIFGQIAINGNIKTHKHKFLSTLNKLNHRGPDDEGFYINNKIAFGHKRLSIIDLSKSGKQPMVSRDRNHIISFNGEIYNYKELRKNLIVKGYKFFSATDTEVLLYGIIEEGVNFIRKCNGMFAFSYHNVKKNISYIFRDRVGIKPLFYCKENEKITFSSESKLINLYLDISNPINTLSIYAYLSYRQPIGNQTYFKNINSLEPGYYIEISNDKFKKKKYWDFKNFYKESKIDRGENFYVERLKSILESSVKYRLNSDREVASLLSGGLDSSIVSSLINRSGNNNFKAFSIGYMGKGYNEFKYSAKVAKNYSMSHKIIKSNSEQYFDDMEKLIDIKGQPLSIPNEVSQYRLCKEIKKHATVVLSGTGADELFCGYGRIFGSVYDYQKLKSKNYFKNLKDRKIFIKNFERSYGLLNFKNQVEHFNHLYSYTDFEMKNNLLSNNLNIKKYELYSKEFITKLFNSSNSNNYLSKMQYLFTKYHLKGILERDDISSMAASVELRVPFLDHRMVEFSATIPEKYKIMIKDKNLKITSDKISEKFDIPKYILRKTFENLVPSDILKRPKIGFPVPLHIWMSQKKIKDRIFSALSSTDSVTRDIFNYKFINKILSNKNAFVFKGDSRKYQSSLAANVWMLYNLEVFLKKTTGSK